jgi:hypothetical protein
MIEAGVDELASWYLDLMALENFPAVVRAVFEAMASAVVARTHKIPAAPCAEVITHPLPRTPNSESMWSWIAVICSG